MVPLQTEQTSREAKEHVSVKIATLTPESRNITIKFKVVNLPEPRCVRSRSLSREYEVVDAKVADETGKIDFTLWNEDCDLLKVGCYYILFNGNVSVYDCSMKVTKGSLSEIQELKEAIENIDESVDMSRPFAWKKPKLRHKGSRAGRTFTGEEGRETKGYCSWKSF